MSLVQNRKAKFNYEILEKYTAGIVLRGVEVKAVRGGHMSLEGAHVSLMPKILAIKKNAHRLSLIGATITPLQPMNVPSGYNPVEARKLLMNDKEMDAIEKEMKNKGTTIVPLSVFTKRGLIKVEIALVRGKKKFDKRETLKKKDAKREIDRVLKGGK
ncbi:MAG: SsrA-binding protein SmpB [Patescibacteria group bacterium]